MVDHNHIPAHPRESGDPDGLSAAARDVLSERYRQQNAEGWTVDHDDEHTDGALAAAASAYAFSAYRGASDRYLAADPVGFWPWDVTWWKPRSAREDLVRAGALILAEIERLDRAPQRAWWRGQARDGE